MTNKERVRIIESNVDKVYEAGQRAGGNNAFWDVYQQGGDRRDYKNAFIHPWDDTIFYPTRDIIASGAEGGRLMFFGTNITDIVKRLDECKVTLDCSGAESLYQAFQSSRITSIPELNLTSCKDLTLAFRDCKATSITLKGLRADCTFDRTFYGCSYLTELDIEGTIGVKNFNVASCPLSANSIGSILKALETKTSSGYTITLGDINKGTLQGMMNNGEIPEGVTVALENGKYTCKGWTLE